MDQVEVEGNSIDEAIDRALRQLGVERARAEVEILSDATRGLFGLGGRKAKVRATVRAPLCVDPPPVPRPDDASPARRRPQRAQVAPARTTAFATKPSVPRAVPQASPTTTHVASDASLDQAKTALCEIVRRMGVEVTVETLQDEEGIRLSLTGDSGGILIGRRGQTLDAIEYVINRIATHGDDHSERIIVDSENYRLRRRQSLEELAQRMAEQARRQGKAVTLNPMSPRDRRVVHLALQSDPSLVTRSSGTGFYRKLLIVPAGAGRRRLGTKGRAPADAEASK